MTGTARALPVEGPPAGSPAWWTARRGTTRAPAVPITLERIVAAALGLIDEVGLAELSMRRLASELGTGTTTLYRHVAGKEEVLVLVADAVFSEGLDAVPAPKAAWREVLSDLAWAMRATLARHPNVVGLFAVAVPVGPNSLRVRELILGALRQRGFDPRLAADVYTALAHHVLASVMQESTSDFRRGGAGAEALTLGEFYRSLPVSEYPHIVELADELTSRTADEEFEFGLECFLDGVERRLKGNRRRRGQPEVSVAT